MDSKGIKSGVRATYTESQVQAAIRGLISLNFSLREIAREIYGGKVTHSVIQKARDGQFPKDPHKRQVLGLDALVPVPICPTCGAAPEYCGHCYAVTPRSNGKPKRKRQRVLVDLPPDLSAEELEAVRDMTKKERLDALLIYIEDYR